MKKFIKILTFCLIITAVALTFAACNSDSELIFGEWAFAGLRTEDAALENGAEFRLMSYNVLVGIPGWGGTPVKPRAQMFSEVLKHYEPDVVALQEYDGDWYKYATPQIEGSYSYLETRYDWFGENRSTMIYNSRKFDLLDSGFHKYSNATQNYCRAITWGVFKSKADGKVFAATSTHWDFGNDDKKSQMINSQVNELTEIINEIAEKYNCPIFAAGDYNAADVLEEEGGAFYARFVEKAAVEDVKYREGVKHKIDYDKFTEKYAIDHIFLKGNADIKCFGILAGNFYEDLSDHFPIYIDFAM